jgi:hypothetical protein
MSDEEWGKFFDLLKRVVNSDSDHLHDKVHDYAAKDDCVEFSMFFEEDVT